VLLRRELVANADRHERPFVAHAALFLLALNAIGFRSLPEGMRWIFVDGSVTFAVKPKKPLLPASVAFDRPQRRAKALALVIRLFPPFLHRAAGAKSCVAFLASLPRSRKARSA
jgi:hypothetical protein